MILKCPDNCSGCNYEGVEFTPDKKGHVDVPDAAAVLFGHGFVLVGASPEAINPPADPPGEGGQGA